MDKCELELDQYPQVSNRGVIHLIPTKLYADWFNYVTNDGIKYAIDNLEPIAKRILDKYNGRFPKMINEQTMNEEIKEIGKLVPGLNRSIQIKYTKGGVEVKETLKRYQLLVLHCARRTLATKLVTELGIDLKTVCLITGHKSVVTLEIYLKQNNKKALTGVIDKVKALEESLFLV